MPINTKEQELIKLTWELSRLADEMERVRQQIQKVCAMEEDGLLTIKAQEVIRVADENIGITTPSKACDSQLEPQTNEIDNQGINSKVLEFLELNTSKDRYEFLQHLNIADITEVDVETMAMAVNITITGSELEEKLYDLKNCVSKLIKWEFTDRRR